MTNPEACGQTAPSAVCNPDGILQSLDRLVAALSALTADNEYSDCGGYEMAVVVVSRILGGSERDTEAFAKGTLDNWGVGKAGCNNGIVLAVAVDDRHMHIATGRGAAEHIPDRELSFVIEQMKPLMREQRYVEAIEQCISDIARILSGEKLAHSLLYQCAPVLALFCFAFVVSAKGCVGQRRYSRCKHALTQIEREKAEANAHRYQVKSCAICLETFEDTSKKETRVLSCGHTFHACCVDTWEESRGSCPVCRRPTNPEAASGTTASVPLHRGSFTSQTSYVDYEQEHHFRIGRARSLYPDYISSNMADRWCMPGYRGPIIADTAFIRSSPSYSSGSSRSSSGGSFGGGCSSGGGGAGGSW